MTTRPIVDTGEDDGTAIPTPPPTSLADEYRARAASSADRAYAHLDKQNLEAAVAWTELARIELAISVSYMEAQLRGGQEGKEEERTAAGGDD